ncbi:hypothetical protein OHA61_22860 [Streptomyces sp. NBC_00885]|nr:hypothetical protein OHA61_22860 [Streptomyces sp. NBC_00885]
MTAATDREATGQGYGHTKRRDFIYFYPLYTGTPIPVEDWRNRMWLDSWV